MFSELEGGDGRQRIYQLHSTEILIPDWATEMLWRIEIWEQNDFASTNKNVMYRHHCKFLFSYAPSSLLYVPRQWKGTSMTESEHECIWTAQAARCVICDVCGNRILLYAWWRVRNAAEVIVEYKGTVAIWIRNGRKEVCVNWSFISTCDSGAYQCWKAVLSIFVRSTDYGSPSFATEVGHVVPEVLIMYSITVVFIAASV